MALFTRFARLPEELRRMIWKAAAPQSPSIHFLSQLHTSWTVVWLDLSETKRTINVDKDPDTGRVHTGALTWARYTSYLARFALLHACRESRRVCLERAASADAQANISLNIVSTNHYALDLAEDIICIQDLHFCFPGTAYFSPQLSPKRIALELRPYVDCNNLQSGTLAYPRARNRIGRSGCGSGFVEGLVIRNAGTTLKVIYLLDYNIKPKYPIAASTSRMDDQGGSASISSEQNGSESSTVQLSCHTSTHNGKFDGHGVTFYALSANTQETSLGWDIHHEAWEFHRSLRAEVHTYGYEVVHTLEEANEGPNKVCLEFLACVRP